MWSRAKAEAWLPAAIARDLLRWDGEPVKLVDTLHWCHRHPSRIRRAFRSREGWHRFLVSLQEVLHEGAESAPRPSSLSVYEASLLYQTLYWVARTAAAPLPPADVVHVTAAGWSSLPAALHRHTFGTPVLLTEHGLYVREAYLAAVQGGHAEGLRFVHTRVARGLARLAYATADVVCPVTEAHSAWEEGFGVDPQRIHVIVNGVDAPRTPEPLPQRLRVVSVGRIDPLKDLSTMLRVADRVRRHLPDVEFHHYGPVAEGQEVYARSIRALRKDLRLGDHFAFKGPTTDPHGVVRAADLVLMTSISEGLPMAVLEGMAQARPIVATAVGGVADMVRGCGLTAPPGDVHGLASAIVTLLRNPDLAGRLGQRGRKRVQRRYQKDRCIGDYRDLLYELAATGGRTDIEIGA